MCFDISQESSPNMGPTPVCIYIFGYTAGWCSTVYIHVPDNQANMCCFHIFLYVHINWCLLKTSEPDSVCWVLVIVWCKMVPTSSWYISDRQSNCWSDSCLTVVLSCPGLRGLPESTKSCWDDGSCWFTLLQSSQSPLFFPAAAVSTLGALLLPPYILGILFPKLKVLALLFH